MKRRAVVIVISGAIGWIAGTAAQCLVAIADSPGWYLSHPWEAVAAGMSGSPTYALAPILLIATTALALPKRSSTALYATVAVAWVALTFGWWARTAVSYNAAFPWWGFERHFLFALPAALACALAFGLALRGTRAHGDARAS
jgi:hypothetical protein